MLNNEGQCSSAIAMLHPESAAATANATSSWIDVRQYEGDLVFTAQIGALTGSLTWTVEDATDNTGTGAANVTLNGAAFSAGAANQIQKRTVGAGAVRGFVRCVGTIVTGPVLVAFNLKSRLKTV